MSERSCDGCALCCKLLNVSYFNSPAGEWCKFCTTRSCAIFGQLDRQKVCGPYKCLWLTDDSFSEELKPNRCNAVFEAADDKNILVFVEDGFANAWKTGEINQKILSFLAEGHAVVVAVGTDRHTLLPEGRTSDEVWSDLRKALKRAQNGCASI